MANDDLIQALWRDHARAALAGDCAGTPIGPANGDTVLRGVAQRCPDAAFASATAWRVVRSTSGPGPLPVEQHADVVLFRRQHRRHTGHCDHRNRIRFLQAEISLRSGLVAKEQMRADLSQAAVNQALGKEF